MSFLSRVMTRTRTTNNHPRVKPRRCRFLPRFEQLEGRLMLDATAVANAEHIAVFGVADAQGVVTGGLVPDSAVTVKSIASGNWSNPAIWSTGTVPQVARQRPGLRQHGRHGGRRRIDLRRPANHPRRWQAHLQPACEHDVAGGYHPRRGYGACSTWGRRPTRTIPPPGRSTPPIAPRSSSRT